MCQVVFNCWVYISAHLTCITVFGSGYVDVNIHSKMDIGLDCARHIEQRWAHMLHSRCNLFCDFGFEFGFFFFLRVFLFLCDFDIFWC